LLLMAALTGCELRSGDRADAEPEPQPSETLSAAEPPAEETPAASIIRPDVSADAEREVVEVPEPLAATVGFPDGGSKLAPEAVGVLQDVMKSKQLTQGWPIVLRGHTDSAGNDSGNLIASRRRAEEVAGWLVDQGVAQERIEVIAMGEQRPIAPNAKLDGTPDEVGRARNRRVEIWIGPAGTHPSETPLAPSARAEEDAKTDREA